MLFDVSSAFLSGSELGRQFFIRAPRDGPPTATGRPAARPRELLEVLKGAYGLAEAPRLWYLRARELLIEIGFVELSCARAAFISWNKDRTVGLLMVHEDDGTFIGDRGNNDYQRALKGTKSKFNIEE